MITDKDIIEKVITSRKFDSASGPDGIDYTVYKLAHNEAASFIQCIMKIIMKIGRVP